MGYVLNVKRHSLQITRGGSMVLDGIMFYLALMIGAKDRRRILGMVGGLGVGDGFLFWPDAFLRHRLMLF